MHFDIYILNQEMKWGICYQDNNPTKELKTAKKKFMAAAVSMLCYLFHVFMNLHPALDQ